MKRRFQFGLRSLLVLITALGVWLGFTVDAARRQREVVAAIEAVGGAVAYDWEVDDDLTKPSGRSEPPGPARLRRLLGDEYFQSVEGVFFAEQLDLDDDQVPPFEQLKTIKYLAFGSTRVSDRILPRVTSLPRLKFLDITTTLVTDEGLRQVGRIRSLEELWLGGRWREFNRVSDAGVQHLTALDRLSRIDFYQCVTDKCIPTLKQMKNLREVRFCNCVSEKGADELRKALPGCKVERAVCD